MFRLLFLLSITVILLACGRSESSEDVVKELQVTTKDSSVTLDILEDELKLRERNPSGEDDKVITVKDSFLTMGDTLRWVVRSRVLKPDSIIKKFPTDSIRVAYEDMVKAIYPGDGPLDNRQDWYQLETGSPYRKTAEQTVCLMQRKMFRQRPDGTYELRARKFTEGRSLCSAERFSNQPVGGFCSGFAVSDKLIVTAGHCVTSVEDLSNFFIVFNFRQVDSLTTNQIFQRDEIYAPVAIVERALDGSGHDFAVLRVGRSIPPERIATVRETDVVEDEEIFVVGHPCGLPLKVADGARVLNNSLPTHFLANLDTYGGNSGSPVYDSLHRVVGILVRGATDFEYNHRESCYQSNVCDEDECTGESVSRSSQFLPYIQRVVARR